MAINKFNNTYFKDFFEYSNSNLIEIANNLYEKIKGNGILPEYIEREKEINRVNIEAVETFGSFDSSFDNSFEN